MYCRIVDIPQGNSPEENLQQTGRQSKKKIVVCNRKQSCVLYLIHPKKIAL